MNINALPRYKLTPRNTPPMPANYAHQVLVSNTGQLLFMLAFKLLKMVFLLFFEPAFAFLSLGAFVCGKPILLVP